MDEPPTVAVDECDILLIFLKTSNHHEAKNGPTYQEYRRSPTVPSLREPYYRAVIPNER